MSNQIQNPNVKMFSKTISFYLFPIVNLHQCMLRLSQITSPQRSWLVFVCPGRYADLST